MSLGDATFSVESASGELPVRYGVCELEIRQGNELFAWRINIGIVTETWSEAILGHVGFLQFFDATYSYADKIVELKSREKLMRPKRPH